MIDYKKYFPYDSIRPEQDAILKQIAENWDKKKYFILQCDVGTGKSGIAKTVANWCENSFIITETKQLQQQYVDDFSHENNMVSIKGKSNYQCNRNGRLTCENGPCTLRKTQSIPACMTSCKYYSLRKRALASPIVLTSYAYIFRAFEGSAGGLWKPRKLMVFDECHLMEDQLLNFATFEVNPEALDKQFALFNFLEERKELLQPFKEEGWTENNKAKFNKIYKLVTDKRSELFDMIKEEIGESEPENLDEDQLDMLSKTHKNYYDIDNLYRKMDLFFTAKKDDWIIAPNATDGALCCTPLNVDSLFKRFCNNWAEKFIFMSATILDIDGYIKDLGIDPDDCLILTMGSSFDPAKSPIYYMPCGSMNYETIDESLPKACSAINLILSKKPDEKGIIHTGNYKVANKIWNEKKIAKANHERFLIKATDEITNQNLLKVHERSKNTVLLSPSMTTGVDLKDDLSRFQIVVKMPFTSLADPRTKKKAAVNSNWYICQMLKTLVQACGRSTRSADDYSQTYILDSSFKYWVTHYKKWLPKSFLDRIKGF
jgi:ATP-dependent DNA helicase DinG